MFLEQMFLRQFFFVCLLVLASFSSLTVNAEMVSTESAIQTEFQHFSKQQLLDALESKSLQDKLMAHNLDAETVKAKIAALTPAEIETLNQSLENEPAGAGVAGFLVVVFLGLMVTDAFCVTDVFNFVDCL